VVDWKYWISVGVSLVGLWLTWRQGRKSAGGSMNAIPLKGSYVPVILGKYWPLVIMFFLMIGSWIPYTLSRPAPPPALIGYGAGYHGVAWPTPGVPPKVFITVDGRTLMSYKDSHHIAGVAFHVLGDVDRDDIRDLQKSTLYDIHAEDVDIFIPVDEKFMTEFSKGYRGTAYRALLVPNSVRMEDFQTLREGYKLGIVELGHGGGAP
jgi:hypothetical protein